MGKSRKGELAGTIPFNANALDNLQTKGYNFVQIKGFTVDNHYDYIEP